MSDITAADPARAYARLKSDVTSAGILDRGYLGYALLISFVFAGYAGSTAAIVYFDGIVPLTLSCLSFVFFTVQLAGLMHDSGHRAVFKSRRWNDVLGYTACGLIGMVFGSWRERHNAHHAHPNQEELDPDLEIPFIATTRALYLRKSALQRFFVNRQAYYYYPLGMIVAFSNRFGSLTWYWRHRSWGLWWQFAIYLTGMTFLFVLPFVFLPLAKAAFVFLFIHLSTGVYLASCFAPNHKGMLSVGRREVMSFIEQQVVTARNIRGGFVTELLMVGLNHQIEHHLFPNTPRHKLKLLKPYVRSACTELGISYAEVSVIETNRQLVHELVNVPLAASRPMPEASPAS